ncbi:MAG: mandelate racemase/muconate lactonizing enzyme family protein [Acidobacteria bacterium]|nr:mandelate racemase/muconate lactonizing enzyme family protein [Acidobacteriota bacterium]
MKPAGRREFLLCAGAAPEVLREAAERAGVSYPSAGLRRENIKITDIQVTPLSYVDPKRNLWRTDRYIVWKTDAALCRVFTDRGIVGIAEGTPYAGPDKIKTYTEETIKPILIGQNPFDVDFIAFGGGGADRLISAAWAGVNNACWDILGKALNTPVYKLLAKDTKPDPHIRIYASGGVEHEWYNQGDEFLIEEALRYQRQGFTAFKFRSGTAWQHSKLTLKQYLPVMRRLRAAVGPRFELIHETLRAQPVTLDEVLNEFCPLAEELKFHWFEQPMKTLEEYAAVNRALKTVPVSGGESDRNRFEIKPWMDSDAIDIVQTDCNVTGLSENWHIARMAHLRRKLLCPHNWHGGLTTIANAHLVAAIPNRHMLELNQTYNPLKEEIFQDPLVVRKGYMDLPDRPGYGVELVPGVEKKFPWTPGSYLRPNPLLEKS